MSMDRVEDVKKIIKEIPKVELHIHLDGSVRKTTMEELLERKIVNEEIYMTDKEDLNAYLKKFACPIKCMQTKKSLQRISRELVEDLKEDNVIYAEIRFAPFKHTEKGLTTVEVIESILKGIHEVEGIKTNLILCMMRGDSLEKNMEVINLAQLFKEKGVVAIDLAGAEALYKTETYKELFKYAKDKGISYTVHAGEADGVDSIEAALSFGAKRIGHGIRIMESKSLLQKALEEGILFEVCPTSNTQTISELEYKKHPIYKMYQRGLCVSINTDNRTVSNITIVDEYLNLVKSLLFTIEDLIKMNEMAIEGAFISDKEKEQLKFLLYQ